MAATVVAIGSARITGSHSREHAIVEYAVGLAVLPRGNSHDCLRRGALGTASPGGGKYVPDGDEHRRDRGPDDKAVEAENGDASERRNQHHKIWKLGILADQEWPQEIVHEADNEGAERDQKSIIERCH